MRRFLTLAAPALLAIAGCHGNDAAAKPAGPPPAAAVAPDLNAIAQSIVTRSLGVKQGDKVLVSGSPRDLELLEDIVTNVAKVGADPLPLLQTERMARASYDEVPAKYDSLPPLWQAVLNKTADRAIVLDVVETPDLLAHVPASRIAARSSAADSTSMINIHRHMPVLQIGNGMYPTNTRAALFGMSRDQLATFYWKALNADFTELQQNAKFLEDAIGNAKELHITDANGTDVRVGIAKKKWYVSDGVMTPEGIKSGDFIKYLPAGELYSRIDPGSAEGTIVADKYPYQSTLIDHLTVKVSKGRMVSMTAKSGIEELQKAYDAEKNDGKNAVSVVDMGLNPGIHASDAPSLRTWVPEGMITIQMGNDTWAGGTNNSGASFVTFLSTATVTADGKVIIENGKLKK